MRVIVIAAMILCGLFSEAQACRLPWCGIYMGQYFGMHDRSLWVARNWAKVGSPAGGPSEGVVVVWPHHVGVIAGRTPSGEWIVHSGNDGGAVRTRARSLRGVIAFRQVGSGFGSAYANLKGQEYTVARRNKHLVALAVEGGDAPAVRTRLGKTGARARLAEQHVEPGFGVAATTFAGEAPRAYKVRAKKGQTVAQGESMLVGLFAPVPDPVVSRLGERGRWNSPRHSSPRIQLAERAASHPSSRASHRLSGYTPHAYPSWGNAGRARADGAVAGWREYRPDLL